MSVLKSILHHWNSTSKTYDTLHPETEVGQITDFGKGLLNQLAATTVQSVISALQTNSWFGQLLKLVLSASGVKYSIDTNGYVCLGSFFGGLIIQWGYSSPVPSGTKSLQVYYPIAFNKIPLTINLTAYGNTLGLLCWLSASEGTKGFVVNSTNVSDGSINTQVSWFAIGG